MEENRKKTSWLRVRVIFAGQLDFGMISKGQQCSLTVPDNEISQGPCSMIINSLLLQHSNQAHAVHGCVPTHPTNREPQPTWPAGTAVALGSLQARGTVVAGVRGTLQDVQLTVGPLEAGVTAVTMVAVGHQTQPGISSALGTKAPGQQRAKELSCQCSHPLMFTPYPWKGKFRHTGMFSAVVCAVHALQTTSVCLFLPSFKHPEFCCWEGASPLLPQIIVTATQCTNTLNPIPPTAFYSDFHRLH